MQDGHVFESTLPCMCVLVYLYPLERYFGGDAIYGTNKVLMKQIPLYDQ